MLRDLEINDTSIYACRARIAYKPFEKNTEDLLRRRKRKVQDDAGRYKISQISGFQCTRLDIYSFRQEENDSFSANYKMEASVVVRVSRRKDYYVHKIVAMVIGCVVVVTLLLLVGKKGIQNLIYIYFYIGYTSIFLFPVLGHKLGWESKEDCNYAPEWPNGVPARRIASAGSLYHSRSTLRYKCHRH